MASTNEKSLERYLIRHEWEHCPIYGNWISICVAGLPSSDSGACPIQRGPRAISRSPGYVGPYVQVSHLQ